MVVTVGPSLQNFGGYLRPLLRPQATYALDAACFSDALKEHFVLSCPLSTVYSAASTAAGNVGAGLVGGRCILGPKGWVKLLYDFFPDL